MRRLPVFLAAALVTAAGVAPAATAATVFSLAPEFSDHAVLQRDRPVPVWGTAPAGQKVSIAFSGQSPSAVAGPTGQWQAMLAPMAAAAEPATLTATCAGETLTRRDLLVGDVWLCSGQSNMEWPLYLARGAAEEMAQADEPWLRQLAVDKRPSDEPSDTLASAKGWVVATPGTVGEFTAVGYFFATALHRRLGVPIGVIHASWGGTPIESWLTRGSLESSSAWPEFQKTWLEALKTFPEQQRAYPELDRAWRAADEASRRTGQPNPLPWPHPPIGPGTAYAPAALYNGMIHPLAPYALRGVAWYQGESNVGHAREYTELFPAMIHAWRERWRDPNLPFLFVQLPNFADADPADTAWAELRAAQATALALPHTAMVVTIDLGEAHNLHPTDKRPVGERLARAAAATVYGLPVDGTGPVVREVRRDAATVIIAFDHADGLELRDAAAGFALAGADGKFVAAMATIEGDAVRVVAPGVSAPAAVRYAWANQPAVSLYNAAGLPAAPFERPVK